jgi:effector-binding domain-containing protein
MEFPDLCLSYMANDGGLASAADLKSLHRKRQIRIRDFRAISGTGTINAAGMVNIGKRGTSVVNLCRDRWRAGRPMKYLLWDEGRAGVLTCQQFATCIADVSRDTQDEANVLNKAQGEYLMRCPRPSRLVMVALVPVAAISFGFAAVALAQTAAPAPPAASTPATPATPATPPSTNPPAAAATPAKPPASPAPVQTADPFGEEITLTPKTVVAIKGTANWDSAFDTLVESLKSLSALLDKQGIKPSGNSMIVYTSTDDTGFTYLAEIPVEQDPKNLTKAMSMGKSPDGKALKFVHRGSYDNMDNTYEAITNHLDDKKLEAKDTFIEEYITDPLKTAEDKLVINVYVPLK